MARTDSPEEKTILDHRVNRRDALKGVAGVTGSLALGPHLRALVEAPQTPHVNAGGTLVFGLSSYPPSFNPFLQTGTAARTVHLAVYRGLLGYDNQGHLRGELAESMHLEGDRTYIFKLRPNAVFHNGEPVTAEDVKYSIELIRDPKSSAYLYAQMQVVSAVKALDAHTVQITLKQPTAPFPLYLAEPEAPIISQKTAGANATNWVGAGPFIIQSAEQGTKVVVSKFPRYYEAGLPKLSSIQFVAYADDTARVNALEAGNVDIIEYVPWQSMPSIRSNRKLALQNTEGPFMYLIFNVTSGPFRNAQVRRAVGYAIKRQDILSAAFFNQGAVLNGVPIPSASPYYNKTLADYWSYDPEKAKHMIAQAGYPHGFSASLLATSQYGMHQDTAEVVQQALNSIGLKITLKLPDWPTRLSLGDKGQYDLAVQGSSGDYNDPDFLTPFVSGPPENMRSYGFNDARIDQLLAAGRFTTDVTKRKPIYDKLQQAILEQAPLVGLSWRAQGYALSRSVSGFSNLPGFLTYYSGYTLVNTSK